MNKKTKNIQSSSKQVKTKTVALEKKNTFSPRNYLLFLGFITFIIFANTISNGYNIDDNLVTQNHPLTSGGLEAIGEIFTSPYYSDAMGYAYGYRPIVHVSYAIEHTFFGEKPGVSHFFNVILYVLSVLLFFKLLLKWVGEKNVLLATIIVLLFAVHPIHTEVVASLKNRDEILAFLFIILSGLSLEKYFSKQKWSSLIFVFLYFSFAMLSKKSVYPMVLVLPLISVLLREISWKHLLLATTALVIPGALVASELVFSKFMVFTLLPIVGIGVIYFLKWEIQKDNFSWKNFWLHRYLWSGLAFLLAVYSVYTSNFLFVPFALIICSFVYSLDQKTGLTVLTLVSLLLGIWFDYIELKQMVTLILLTVLIEPLLQKEKMNYWLMTLVSLSILSMIYSLKLGQIASLVAVGLFAFLFLKRKMYAVIFALFVLVVSFFIKFQTPYFTIMLLLFIGLYSLSIKRKQSFIFHLFPLLFGVILILSPRFLSEMNQTYRTKYLVTEQVNQIVEKGSDDSYNQSILKEGRKLEYIENTLVKPHTIQETIATGFATLGEYLRLQLFPVELSYYYGFSKVKTENFSSFWVWISILVHFGLVVLALVNPRKKPLITLGILWYLMSILLFSNWVELVAGMVGERLVFTASAGFSIFLVSILFWIKPNLFRQKWGVIEIGLAVVLLLFMGRTFTRNEQWESPLTLMEHDISHLSNSAQANNLYALNLMAYSIDEPSYTAQERREMQLKAISHFERAAEIWPDFMNAYYDIGRSASIVGDTKKSIQGYKRAIALDSTFFDAYYNLLNVYDQAGEKENYFHLSKILFQKNKNVMEYSTLARGYYLMKDYENCLRIIRAGLIAHPNSQDLKSSLQSVEQEILTNKK